MAWTKHQLKWYGKWHTCLGIIAGFIVSIVSVTGSLLVFRYEIDKRLNPAFYDVSHEGRYLEYNDIIPLIRRRYPDVGIRSVRKAGEKNEGSYIVAAGQQELFFDPYTGRKLGERHSEKHFIGITLKIHRFLLIPVVGRYIVGASTLGLLILMITGLRLWLPKKWKQLGPKLSVRFHSGLKRQSYDWHNLIGVITSPVVGILAVTGLCMTLNLTSMPLVFMLDGRSPAALLDVIMPRSKPSSATATLADVMDTTRLALDKGGIVTQLSLPGKDTAAAYRMLATIPDSGPGRKVMLSVDRYSGAILSNTEQSLPVAGHIYFTWLQAMHYGTIGGMTTRILTFIGGLVPFIMLVTGWIVWWPRYRKNLRKNGEAVADQPSSERHQTGLQTFRESFGKGIRYAGIVIMTLAAMGLIYGLIAGYPLQVVISCIVLSSYVVVSNFLFALLFFLLYALFFLPFRRFRRKPGAMIRYFSYSGAFALVFIMLYVALMTLPWSVF